MSQNTDDNRVGEVLRRLDSIDAALERSDRRSKAQWAYSIGLSIEGLGIALGVSGLSLSKPSMMIAGAVVLVAGMGLVIGSAFRLKL